MTSQKHESHGLLWILLPIAAAGLWFVPSPVSAADVPQPPVAAVSPSVGIRYELDFSQASQHLVTVRMHCPSARRGRLWLTMPTWTPGSYLIREYSRHIQRIEATDAEQRELPLQRASKNEWIVVCEPGDRVTVEYELYCREMSVRTNFVDQEVAIINGAPTFLTLRDAGEVPHQVQLQLLPGWSASVTALAPAEGMTNTWVASSYTELVDSPILCGNPEVASFDTGGRPHVLASFGDTSLWDHEKAAADVEKIVAEHQRMWGQVPYPHYIFLNAVTESGGGLEHDNSTLVMTGRVASRNKERYEDWLSLVSHEFFHTWNVRRLRPKELSDYDLDQENYTRSLWIAEGITSYYEDIALCRAGLIDDKAWLQRFSKNIERLQQTPGRLVQSLSDSSYETWIKFYRPNENSRNTQTSYYGKGAVVAFLLDARIRELTDGKRSLDDVMQLMYSRFADHGGYLPKDFRKAASEVCQTDLSDWFAEHVDAAGELDYSPALNWYGLTFPGAEENGEEESDESEGQGSDDTSDDSEVEKRVWLGISTTDRGGRATISRVLAGSPAAEAGLNVDDELIAVEDYRLSGSSPDSLLELFSKQETVSLLIARRGRLIRIAVSPTSGPDDQWQLKTMKEPSEEQSARLKQLLGTRESLNSDGESEG